MLRADVIEEILIQDRGNSVRVRKSDPDQSMRFKDRSVDVCLDDYQIDHIDSFLLRYYMEGVAQVPHIDVQINGHDEAGGLRNRYPPYLTIWAQESREPLPGHMLQT